MLTIKNQKELRRIITHNSNSFLQRCNLMWPRITGRASVRKKGDISILLRLVFMIEVCRYLVNIVVNEPILLSKVALFSLILQ